MIHRIGRRNFKIYAMDIESHNDPESIKKNETSAWLGCMIDETNAICDPKAYFYDIGEFIDRLEYESAPRRTKERTRLCSNVAVYIYNLSFEWSFILPVLLERGFSFREQIGKEDEFAFNSVSTRSCSSVWSVELKFGKKNGIVYLRDLAKIYGGGLRNVAKSFGLKTQKGEIDYRENRLHRRVVREADGREHPFVTLKEMVYCYKDTKIIVELLEKTIEMGDKDFWKSISMASYSMRHLIRRGYPRALKPYMKFREDYPVLGQEENDFLRQGVEGGITYAPERWQFKVIDQPLAHIDLHQAHPSSAYLNLFPHGKGEHFVGAPPLGKRCACKIKITFDAVKIHSIIKLIGLPMISGKEIVVWDIEIPTMRKCYVNLKVEYLEGYAYDMHPLPWREYYATNYRKRLNAKKKGDEFGKMYYKLLNNSSYGKFLEKPHNIVIENIIGADGVITSDVREKPVEEWKTCAKYTYLPIGSLIPAYTRVTLIEGALRLGWKNIVYFDTDSIFFIWNEESAKGWARMNKQDFLGGWGWEHQDEEGNDVTIDRAQFTAPKRYKTEIDGKTDIKAGGINFAKYKVDTGRDPNDNIPFDEVNIISSTWEVQRAYRCKGGTLIKFQKKKMDIQPKYKTIYNKNVSEGVPS